MADENTTGVPYDRPYPYLRKVSVLPAVSVPRDINLSDMLILVQSTTTKKVAIEHVMSRIIDLIDAPDAYQLACRNGFEGTLQEWLLSLKGDGVNTEELGWVVGKHQVVDGSMDIDPPTGNPIAFTRSGTLPIAEDAFIIYRDVNTEKLYTKTEHGSVVRWSEWSGLLDPFTYINEVIGEKGSVPTYEANKLSIAAFPTVSIVDQDTGEAVIYDYLDGVRDQNGDAPYRWDPTDFSSYPSVGELVRFVFSDDRYGELMFYNGNNFLPYTGVLDYVQAIVNNMYKINAGSATRLQTARVLDIVSNITDDNITSIDSISFDGSKDENFVIKKLNGELIYGDMSHIDNLSISGNLAVGGTTVSTGKVYANGGIEVTGPTKLNGTLNVTGLATFADDVTMQKNLSVQQNVNVTGNIIATQISATKVVVTSTSQSDAISYDAASGITGDTTSSFSTGYFFSPGNANNVAMKINKLSAKLIGNDDYVPKATNAATADVSTKSILTTHDEDEVFRPLVSAENESGEQSLYASSSITVSKDSLNVSGKIRGTELLSNHATILMPEGTSRGISVNRLDGDTSKSLVILGTNELDLYDRADDTIAKVDFRDTSAANLVFCKPIQIEEDATLSIGSETTVTGGDIVLAANEDIYTTVETIEGDDGSVTSEVVLRPAKFIVYRPSVFNSSVTVYSGITADTVHIRSDSGSGYYARNIAYGTSSTPSNGDIHDGDLYIQYT